jgi:hypothetical protein
MDSSTTPYDSMTYIKLSSSSWLKSACHKSTLEREGDPEMWSTVLALITALGNVL